MRWKKKPGTPVRIDVPTALIRLRSLGEEISVRFAHEYPAGLWDTGGDFGEYDDTFRYWCTPTNVVMFGGDGMDGNHFSSLVVDGRIDHRSPVVVTAPSYCSGDPIERSSVVAAADFRDFLRLGLVEGFHVLSHLVDVPERTLSNIAEWGASEPTDPRAVRRRAILRFLASDLGIEPRCPTFEEFQELQARYHPLLKFSRKK